MAEETEEPNYRNRMPKVKGPQDKTFVLKHIQLQSVNSEAFF